MLKKIALWAVGLFALVVAFGMYQGSKPENQEKQRKRDSIALCWSEHERKSLGSDEKQFIAGACERMEAKFRETYNLNP